MDKLMETIVELREKGSLQDQAKRLYEQEKAYKKLISDYNSRIIDSGDIELIDELYLMRNKYQVRVDYVRQEMMMLNKRIIQTLDVIEEHVPFELFMEKFYLLEDEIDEDKSFYDNLLNSSNFIGHICKTGLIENEKYIKEMLEDEEDAE